MGARFLVVNGRSLPLRVRCCDSFLQRAVGLMWAPRAQRQWVWRLHPCKAVHTLFLSAPIDVVFCDRGGEVLRIVPRLPAWRWAGQGAAASAWEFPAGSTERLCLRRGDHLGLSDDICGWHPCMLGCACRVPRPSNLRCRSSLACCHWYSGYCRWPRCWPRATR